MEILHDSYLTELISEYGFTLTPDQCEAIRRYISLLLRWNQRISLTRVTDPIEIARFHFGESLFAVNQVPIRRGRLADVGSGAGFPGLALKIGFPELEVALIEANTKKAAFLSEICRELAMKKVEVLRARVEDLSPDSSGFDFITARALGGRLALLKWAMNNLKTDGRILLWLGGEDAAEIARNSSWDWREPVLIPGSKQRYLLIGSTRRRS